MKVKKYFLKIFNFSKNVLYYYVKVCVKSLQKICFFEKSRNYNNSFLFEGCSKALLIVVFKVLLNISYSLGSFQNFKICIPIYLK
jgi:hypothetical protein